MGRRNTLLIIFSICIVIVAFALAEYRNKKTKKAVYEAPLSITAAEQLSYEDQQDINPNELEDWKKSLAITEPVSSATAEADLTPTDMLARNFFARYMELRQAGLSQDKQSQQDLVGQVLNSNVTVSGPKIYSPKDIIIKTDNDIETVKRYGNEIGDIFKNNSTGRRDETVIVKESLDQDNPKILEEIDPIIATYRKIINLLLRTGAPVGMENMHVNLINAVSKFLFVAESLRQVNSDPMRGLQGASGHIEAGQSLINSLQSIGKHIFSLNITYGASESGIMFSR